MSREFSKIKKEKKLAKKYHINVHHPYQLGKCETTQIWDLISPRLERQRSRERVPTNSGGDVRKETLSHCWWESQLEQLLWKSERRTLKSQTYTSPMIQLPDSMASAQRTRYPVPQTFSQPCSLPLHSPGEESETKLPFNWQRDRKTLWNSVQL